MAPRAYALGKRAESAEETRRRILEAIVALHAEKGIVATTTLDVAARADVSVGTVTRYFPSPAAMVNACGHRLMEMFPPPALSIFDGVRTLEMRLQLLFEAWFSYYESRDRWLKRAYADAERVQALAEALARQHSHREALVREALRPFKVTQRFARVALAFSSFQVWESLRQTGIRSEDAAALMSGMLLGLRAS